MAIATLADYLAAARQTVRITKTGVLSVSAAWYDSIAVAGDPAAGSLAIGNTTTGLVPTDTLAGAPTIADFSGRGYLTRVEATAASSGRYMICDRLFHAGSFPAVVGTTNLTTQPLYSSRVPGGTDYTGLEIWLVMSSGKTGASTAHATYTNQAGTTGQTTAVVSAPSNVSPQCIQLPLAAGDTGVQTIESLVIDTSVTANTWNILVVRPLWVGRLEAGRTVVHWLDQTGMPEVFQDSCLTILGFVESGAVSTIAIDLEIASA